MLISQLSMSTKHTCFLTDVLRSSLLVLITSTSKKKHATPGSTRMASLNASQNPTQDTLGDKVFERTENGNKCAMSFEDETFLEIMGKEVHQDENKNWIAPLPFKSPRLPLPNNRDQALLRLNSLRRTLTKNSQMKEQFSEFMDSCSRTAMQRSHHPSTTTPSAGIYPFSECIIPRSLVRYGWSSTQVPSNLGCHLTQYC